MGPDGPAPILGVHGRKREGGGGKTPSDRRLESHMLSPAAPSAGESLGGGHGDGLRRERGGRGNRRGVGWISVGTPPDVVSPVCKHHRPGAMTPGGRKGGKGANSCRPWRASTGSTRHCEGHRGRRIFPDHAAAVRCHCRRCHVEGGGSGREMGRWRLREEWVWEDENEEEKEKEEGVLGLTPLPFGLPSSSLPTPAPTRALGRQPWRRKEARERERGTARRKRRCTVDCSVGEDVRWAWV